MTFTTRMVLEWFLTHYEYLYNRVKEYNPLDYFLNIFIKSYRLNKLLSLFLYK